METGRPNVRELALALLDAFPGLDDPKRRVALATYRRLAGGVPASPAEIAADAAVDVDGVRRILGDWVGVYTDDEGVRATVVIHAYDAILADGNEPVCRVWIGRIPVDH